MVSNPISITRRRAILTTLVDMYLNDRGFEQRSRSVIQSRNSRVTALKGAVEQFISGTYTLSNLREQIDKVLTTGSSASDTDSWGVRGRNFMESLEKFANNHDADEPRSADILRRLLTGLNPNNLGQRIEEFHIFLVEEEKRFQEATKQEGSNVSPGYSAFILSMFAFWLNSAAKPIIYYLHLCRGLKMLLNAGVLPDVEGLHIVHDRIEVQSQADHLAFLVALEALAAAVLQIRTTISPIEVFWTERFTLWITSHPYEIEQATREDTRQKEGRVLESEYLPLVEETRLQQLINQLRRYVLIDEKVVRRIYHALLAGHVILTGPPGTGKTELAKLIPEILWQQDATNGNSLPTAYIAHVVTATDEWSVHTLLGGIVPRSDNGQISYTIQYGYLTEVVRKNWMPDSDNYLLWQRHRMTSYAPSNINNEIIQEFRGQWLIIDEFNRAPIDLALGEVLTTLSASGGALRVPTDEGYASLPFPRDFRIIGTLNSFDRNYLNQISEALKRRFSFIEILPPTRQQRNAEQAVVLHAALKKVAWLSQGDNKGIGALSLTEGRDNSIEWDGIVLVEPRMTGSMIAPYEIHWRNDVHPFTLIFNAAWHILEVIRIYRQLGTAQAITLFQQIIVAGIIQGYKTKMQWNTALDDALCNTIADQLQVLMPDELNVLYWYVKHADDKAGFINAFNAQLPMLYETSERRLRAQLEVISIVLSTDGNTLLSESEVERLMEQANVRIRDDILTQLFYLDESFESLPQFTYRLRTLRAERGL